MNTPRHLTSLIARCTKPIFRTRDDIREASRCLVNLSPFFASQDIKKLIHPLRKFGRRDPALLTSSLEVQSLDEACPFDGCRLGVLIRALPSTYNAEDFWEPLALTVQQALSQQKWKIQDVQCIVRGIIKCGRVETAFLDRLSEYIKFYIENGTLEEMPYIFMLLSSVPGLKNSDILLAACNKVASMEGLRASSIGQIAYCLNRIQYVHHNLAIAFQEDADRIAEANDLFTAVSVFYFVARHDAQYINTESLQWLAESLLTGDMDRETVITICTALSVLPRKVRESMNQELLEIIVYLSGQINELLELSVAEGGVKDEQSMEVIQTFVSKFLHLSAVLVSKESDPLSYPEEYHTACENCANLVEKNLELLVSDENPPFSLVPHLLGSPTKKVKATGVALLREMAKQSYHIPSLQTFQFVLLLGDHKLSDRVVFKYLRNQFAKTSADIPVVQLCAALKCFAPGLAQPIEDQDLQGVSVEEAVEKELEKEQTELFFRYIKETLLKNVAAGIDFRCAMAIIDTLLELGCEDDNFFDVIFSFMKDKINVITPADQSSSCAKSILSRIKKTILIKHEGVEAFLEAIVSTGKHEEASLSPSEWMNLHDPANALLPLTEEQKEGWKVLDAMVATRAEDRESLIELAKKYIAMLPKLRPDDSKYFFGTFEEKVLKEDILLKECLHQLSHTGIVTKLSASTIAAILHSLSVVRFVYTRTVKEFLNSISAEQWSTMEASPLVHLLEGLAKLSLRSPSILQHIGKRIHEVHRFMSSYEVAQCIHSLQALGFKDDGILMELMQHAASSAKSFDDASLGLLFSAPSVHRLLRKPEIALPLLQRTSRGSLPLRARERVARSISKAPLPRELISTATSELLTVDSTKNILRLT